MAWLWNSESGSSGAPTSSTPTSFDSPLPVMCKVWMCKHSTYTGIHRRSPVSFGISLLKPSLPPPPLPASICWGSVQCTSVGLCMGVWLCRGNNLLLVLCKVGNSSSELLPNDFDCNRVVLIHRKSVGLSGLVYSCNETLSVDGYSPDGRTRWRRKRRRMGGGESSLIRKGAIYQWADSRNPLHRINN